MAVPTTPIEFLICVQKSELLNADTLAACHQELPHLSPDPAKVAGVFVRRGLLTELQARLILSGRYRGFHVGSYTILSEIGRGGMGAVYLAEHKGLRRQTALKVILAAKADVPGVLERFIREAQSAAALDHVNIVRVFDIIRTGDAHWLVMEYVDGYTLDALLQKYRVIPVQTAVSYVAQAAAGLQAAQEKGFVHRDIKPANLMVSKTGIVKILDMGLARSQAANDQLTGRLDRGAILGTADYIAPEQAIRGPDVDIRADLYSLGITLFYLVTGRLPFPGNTTQKLMHHQRTPAPRITDFDPTLPPGLAAVVQRLLAKKPEERYAQPNDLIAALAPWLPSTSGMTNNLTGWHTIPSTDHETLTGTAMASTNRIPRPRSI
ncbi:MAG: serine/threonine protein kinase [Bacteroidales bacterium]|nr:serine/threonine protein kinase [Bacteroidales bacterium]